MKVAVIGAGTMGSGIAQAFAQTPGYEVILTDMSLDFARMDKRKLLPVYKKGGQRQIRTRNS